MRLRALLQLAVVCYCALLVCADGVPTADTADTRHKALRTAVSRGNIVRRAKTLPLVVPVQAKLLASPAVESQKAKKAAKKAKTVLVLAQTNKVNTAATIPLQKTEPAAIKPALIQKTKSQKQKPAPAPDKPDSKPDKPDPKPDKPDPKPDKPGPKPDKPAPKPDPAPDTPAPAPAPAPGTPVPTPDTPAPTAADSPAPAAAANADADADADADSPPTANPETAQEDLEAADADTDDDKNPDDPILKFCITDQEKENGKSALTALLLSVFFGGLGADRFYYGYYATGAVKLLLYLSFFLPCMLSICVMGAKSRSNSVVVTIIVSCCSCLALFGWCISDMVFISNYTLYPQQEGMCVTKL